MMSATCSITCSARTKSKELSRNGRPPLSRWQRTSAAVFGFMSRPTEPGYFVGPQPTSKIRAIKSVASDEKEPVHPIRFPSQKIGRSHQLTSTKAEFTPLAAVGYYRRGAESAERDLSAVKRAATMITGGCATSLRPSVVGAGLRPARQTLLR